MRKMRSQDNGRQVQAMLQIAPAASMLTGPIWGILTCRAPLEPQTATESSPHKYVHYVLLAGIQFFIEVQVKQDVLRSHGQDQHDRRVQQCKLRFLLTSRDLLG